jgi:hypothetical protein
VKERVNMVEKVLGGNVSVLHDMYEKKKYGEPIDEQEKALLNRFQNARLIRALIDPSVDFEIGNYVPPEIELDIAMAIISGRPSEDFRNMSLVDVMRFVFLSLKCGQDLYKNFVRSAS